MKIEQSLEDGLVLRSLSAGYASDREGIGEFYAKTFNSDGDDPYAVYLGPWATDLASDHHPAMTLDDLWVVVDTNAEDKIVSALLLIPQTWRYEDIPFGMGRVELVATDPAYRRRGLIRRLMNTAHERSAALGHPVQGITGIPHYYRQFGYAMAVDLGTRSTIALATIPKLPEGQEPKYRLRSATMEDIADLMRFDTYHSQNGLLSVVRDEANWRYELEGISEGSAWRINIHMIEATASGTSVGYVVTRFIPPSSNVAVHRYALGPESSYLDTFDDVLRGIQAYFTEALKERPVEEMPIYLAFSVDMPEGVDMLMRKTSGLLYPFPYSWYMRIPDMGVFFRHIAPVLERRLEGSAANRFTGEIKIELFNFNGLIMGFEDGKLTKAEHGAFSVEKDNNAAFPYHMFYNVIFGHKSIDDLRSIFPDCWADKTAQVVLDAIFPKKRSLIFPIA